jgi:uncharacterized protein DUF5985
MAEIVYILGALTSLACAVLLLRGYAGSRQPLLLWSAFCFIGLALSNALIFVDLVIFPDIDLYRLRLATAALAMGMLLYGLIWETK